MGDHRIEVTNPYAREKATLASAVASAMGCRSVWNRWGGQIVAVTVIGFESDRQRVDISFTSLLLQATRAVLHQRPPDWSTESTAAYRRTWLLGFAIVAAERLKAANARAVADHDAAASTTGTSAALVLASRADRVSQAYDQRYGHLRKARPRRFTGSGFAAGARAGQQADIGGPRLHNQRRELDR